MSPSPETPHRPVVPDPGEGRADTIGRIAAVFEADAAKPASRHSVCAWWLGPHAKGPGAPAHPGIALFLVREGTLSVRGGERWTAAPRGSVVLVPRGAVRGFGHRGDVRAGIVNLSLPGPFEPRRPEIVRWFAQLPPGDTRARSA